MNGLGTLRRAGAVCHPERAERVEGSALNHWCAGVSRGGAEERGGTEKCSQGRASCAGALLLSIHSSKNFAGSGSYLHQAPRLRGPGCFVAIVADRSALPRETAAR